MIITINFPAHPAASYAATTVKRSTSTLLAQPATLPSRNLKTHPGHKPVAQIFPMSAVKNVVNEILIHFSI